MLNDYTVTIFIQDSKIQVFDDFKCHDKYGTQQVVMIHNV